MALRLPVRDRRRRARTGGEAVLELSITNSNPETVTEGVGNTQVFTIFATQEIPAGKEITATARTVDRSAVGGVDFTKITALPVTLTPAQPTFDVTVQMLGPDAVWKPERRYHTRFDDPIMDGEPVPTVRNWGRGKIIDSLAEPTVAIAAAGTPDPIQQQPTNQEQNFQVTLTGPTTGTDVIVLWRTEAGTATPGEDYVDVQDGQLTIPAGSATGTIKVTILGGDTVLGIQSYSVRLVAASSELEPGAPTLLTITNDLSTGNIKGQDAIAVDDGLPNPQTEGTGQIFFRVASSGTPPLPADVTFKVDTINGTAVAGTDFVGITDADGTILAANGEVQIPVFMLGPDTVWRGDRSFQLRIRDASAPISDDSGTGNITDSLAKPTVAVGNGVPNPRVQEPGNTTITFTISTATRCAYPILVDYQTVNGTATAGEDYVAASGTATIPANTDSVDVVVTVLGGTTVTGVESFTLDISNARSVEEGGITYTITTASGTGNIADGVAPAVVEPLYRLSLNEGSGSPVDDGSIQNGTSVPLPASGVTWITDGDGTGLQMTAAADANLDWPPTTSGQYLDSYGGWFEFKHNPPLQNSSIGFCYNSGSTMAFDVALRSAGDCAFSLRIDNGATAFQTIPQDLTDATFHSLAFSVDCTNRRGCFFLDGVQRLNTTTTGELMGGSPINWQFQPTLGCRSNRGVKEQYWDGIQYGHSIYGDTATVSDILEAMPSYTPAAGEVLRAGGWSFFNAPNCVTSAGYTYVSCVNNAGKVEVAKMLSSTGAVVQRAVLDPRQEGDDHNDATAAVLTDGNIRWFWNDHGGIRPGRDFIRTRRTTVPGDLSTLTAIYEIPGTASESTYTNPFYLPAESRYYVFWRGPGVSTWSYVYSTTGEDGTWSTPVPFMSWPGITGYPVFSTNDNDEIYIGASGATSLTSREDVRHGIFKAETLYQSDGTTQIWAAPSPAVSWTNLTLVYDSGANNRNTWTWGVTRDNVVFANCPTTNPDQNHEAWYGHRTGGNSWTTNKIADVGDTVAETRENFYTAGMWLDWNDPNKVYVAANNLPGETNQSSLRRYVTANNGASWTPTVLVPAQTGKIMRPRNSSRVGAGNGAPSACEIFFMDGTRCGEHRGYAFWRITSTAPEEGWGTTITRVGS